MVIILQKKKLNTVSYTVSDPFILLDTWQSALWVNVKGVVLSVNLHRTEYLGNFFTSTYSQSYTLDNLCINIIMPNLVFFYLSVGLAPSSANPYHFGMSWWETGEIVPHKPCFLLTSLCLQLSYLI